MDQRACAFLACVDWRPAGRVFLGGASWKGTVECAFRVTSKSESRPRDAGSVAKDRANSGDERSSDDGGIYTPGAARYTAGGSYLPLQTILRNTMGLSSKTPDIKPPPKAAPAVTPEDESVKGAGDAERRRLAAMAGRNQTVQSQRAGSSGYKTVLGV